MGRPRLDPNDRRIRVHLSLRKRGYENLKKHGYPSRIVDGLISMYLNEDSLACGRLGVRIPLSPSFFQPLSFTKFYDENISNRPSSDHKKDLERAYMQLTSILSKRGHKNPSELVQDLLKNKERIASKRDLGRMARSLVRYAWETGFLTNQDKARLDRELVTKRGQPDNYVPSAEEVMATITTLPVFHRAAYLAILYSGGRMTELEYCVVHHTPCRPAAGFVKYDLNWRRGKKSAFILYLPEPITEFKLARLKSQIKRHDLLPGKYLRKYFYTAARIIGCPPEIADFIQGRTPKTIGAQHYQDLQRMADEWYPRIQSDLRRRLSP